MVYKEQYRTQIEDYSQKGQLSLSAMLKIFENIGNQHADSVSDEVIKGSQNGVAWILVDWRVEIIKRPQYNKTLDVHTWAWGKAMASQICRDFELYDESGELCAVGSAKFALFDIENGKLFKISQELFDIYKPEERSVFSVKTKRLKEPSEYDCEQSIAIRRSDIDFNGHVHNIAYLDFALEAIPEQIYENDSFKGFHISYIKPADKGDNAQLRCLSEPDRQLVGVYDENSELKALVEILH